MRYLPHTPEDISSMLKVIGKERLEDLFAPVPEDCRMGEGLDLPEAVTEWELKERLSALSHRVAGSPEYTLFLGAGRYEHYVPESVSSLLGRSEFVTSYTPYQPEVSQGTLQAIYEFQTLTAELLGMEVATASHYDGSTALAEALLMAIRVTRKKRVALSALIHPYYRQVVRTYLDPTGYEIVELPGGPDGRTDLSGVEETGDLAAVALQSPNFFGCIEDLKGAADRIRERKALLIASFTEPLAFGLYRSPGDQGADIACGEGQGLGIACAYGGPGLGLFSGKMAHVRHMPGRIVGRAVDRDGRQGFVLTLATREQHIRREKATSNICTNNSLCALTAAMYLASLGGTGFRELARLNYDRAEYLKSELRKAGFRVPFDAPTFNEFVVEGGKDMDGLYARLLEKKIVAGLPLAPFYPERENHYLMCVTETRSRADLDALVREMTA